MIRLNTSLNRNLFLNGSLSLNRFKSKTSFRNEETNVNSDDVWTENNPWSPSLYTDVVKVVKPGTLMTKQTLPVQYRLLYQPLYEAPSAKYVAMLKRLTLSFTVLGMYGAKIIWDTPMFDDVYAGAILITTSIPAMFVQYKTRDYVTRIWRLYNKNKPQLLENLIGDEKLIMEKLNFTGGSTYNELLPITNNKSLQLAPKSKYPSLTSYTSWESVDEESKFKSYFYIVDDIGGMKMDRLWGIVEHNSGVDNGRYMEQSSQQ
ncbi:uncharacterized protein KQ657_002377 [Scheffersomyces spartinae]|uniref:Uncharacterized protein n=1 Tax=Scheffersomyces spartinae TaxID=45513 RepID=A0A9P8AK11_9ASCO|nr:uncharacterized protein KQ657_002377 [Scheffersomyces spartinae]KAG7195990.1 hypothetical protein KQ657_002377 [Scheffersomyces spartinae]